MAGSSIAVVGAGIGGLTAALCLARRGCSVTVIERRSGFSEIGAGIQLSPNASRILLELGLGPALRRVATEPDQVAIRAVATGRPIGAIALGPFMRERFGAPSWVVHRADLQTVLLDAVRSDPAIRLAMGRTVEHAASSEDAATLTLLRTNGQKETAAFDAVVGADGLWSKVRAAMGDAGAPHYRGYVAWRATITLDDAPREIGRTEVGLWLGRARHVVHYPVAGGRLLNIVAVVRLAQPAESWDASGDPADLLARFADAASPLKALLGTPRDWRLWPLFDRPVGRLASGRMALIGDAAHPVLPFLAQGAALAIEDAKVLATHLAPATDVGAALKTYEAARLRRVRRVQRSARLNGLIYHAGPLVGLARDQFIRRTAPEEMSERYRWLYEGP